MTMTAPRQEPSSPWRARAKPALGQGCGCERAVSTFSAQTLRLFLDIAREKAERFGGYSPACNAQFATDTDSQVIVGVAVEVDTVGGDMGKLTRLRLFAPIFT